MPLRFPAFYLVCPMVVMVGAACSGEGTIVDAPPDADGSGFGFTPTQDGATPPSDLPTMEDGPPPIGTDSPSDTPSPPPSDSGDGPCQPNCAGKQCGDDGCGGSCGGCPAGGQCGPGGICPCVPSCTGKQCGNDGCGGSCGTCAGGAPCEGGICQCQPSCAGKQCGDDGCGGSCGECPGVTVCQAHACMCVVDCTGKQCGNDGCGGSCGSCPPGDTCKGGQCTCEPVCDGKECGPNLCGGQCGSCKSYQSCQVGQCVGWHWEVESDSAFGHDQGKKEGDGWACNTADHFKNYMVYGPYIKTIPAGNWTVIFRMLVDNNTADNGYVVELEAFDAISAKKLAKVGITRKQFWEPNKYQDFAVNFTTDGNDSLEFRVHWLDIAYIKVDNVRVQP